MKKLILLIILTAAFVGCREDALMFSLEESTANVFVNSFPKDADIYLDNKFTGKQTPDTLKYLEPGTYQITIKLNGYRDSTVALTVEPAERPTLFVSLNSE